MNMNIEETPLWNMYFEDRLWEKKEDQTLTGEKNEVVCGEKGKVVNR